MTWVKVAEFISKAKASLISNSFDKILSEIVSLLKERPELRNDPGFIKELLKEGITITKEFEERRIRLKISGEL